MKMTFGKYKDKEIVDIPREYLQWVYTVVTTENLKVAIGEVLQGYSDDMKSVENSLDRARKWKPGEYSA